MLTNKEIALLLVISYTRATQGIILKITTRQYLPK
jgi:hypothetical protein